MRPGIAHSLAALTAPYAACELARANRVQNFWREDEKLAWAGSQFSHVDSIMFFCRIFSKLFHFGYAHLVFFDRLNPKQNHRLTSTQR
jgi:hypothetical protein